MELQPIVQQLAGPLPFSAACDLSAALGAAGRGLPLSSVIHAARLDTDEAGSTAAAATAVVAMRSMPKVFQADRPFLVVLRDRQTKTILFLGRVEDPSK
jgi:serpin B